LRRILHIQKQARNALRFESRFQVRIIEVMSFAIFVQEKDDPLGSGFLYLS
jgi:hypothetical protein